MESIAAAASPTLDRKFCRDHLRITAFPARASPKASGSRHQTKELSAQR
jgi:hypothetical protein